MPLLVALVLAQTFGTPADRDAVPLSSLEKPYRLRVEGERPQLVLTGEGVERKVVKEPKDLEGRLRIDTAEKALEYVRFLRSPGLWPLLLKVPTIELRHQPVLFGVPTSLYNDLRIYTQSGWDGVLSEADWKRMELYEPKVGGGEGKDWTIRRACLTRKDDTYFVGTLSERVSQTGRYGWSVDRPEEASRRIRWHITGTR